MNQFFITDHDRESRRGQPARTPNLENRLKNLEYWKGVLPRPFVHPNTKDEQANAELHKLIDEAINTIRLELHTRKGEF